MAPNYNRLLKYNIDQTLFVQIYLILSNLVSNILQLMKNYLRIKLFETIFSKGSI